MSEDQLMLKIKNLPEHLKQEVLHFADFLSNGMNKKDNDTKPVFGSAKGKYILAEDFDKPLEDFKDYM